MSKSTMGTKLPRKLEEKIKVVGEQIKLARLRRDLSLSQVAERATCSPLTVSRIEKGSPTVAIGIYLRVLYALQLDDDILLIAKDDELGRQLQDMALTTRQRASKKIVYNAYYNDNYRYFADKRYYGMRYELFTESVEDIMKIVAGNAKRRRLEKDGHENIYMRCLEFLFPR